MCFLTESNELHAANKNCLHKCQFNQAEWSISCCDHSGYHLLIDFWNKRGATLIDFSIEKCNLIRQGFYVLKIDSGVI